MKKPTNKQVVRELRHRQKHAFDETAQHAADLIEKQAAQIADLKAKLAVAAGAAKDTERLDWLDNNMFHRDKSEYDAKWAPNTTMWVMFTPEGHQGSARRVIDAALEASKARSKEPANFVSKWTDAILTMGMEAQPI